MQKLKSRRDKFGNKRLWNAVVSDDTDTKSILDVEWPDWMGKMFQAAPTSLSWWWKLGSVLQSAAKNADWYSSFSTWEAALNVLLQQVRKAKQAGEKIGLIQFWGHGSPGNSYIGKSSPLGTEDLFRAGRYRLLLDMLREELADEKQAGLWFRNCSVFHGGKGHEFARGFSDFLGCTIVAHTYLISGLQSGLHVLMPGEQVDWSLDEGGITEEDGMSGPNEPNTILATEFYPPRGW